jgi:AmmeMemoRadiSam system protein A
MSNLTNQDKTALLKLARSVVTAKLVRGSVIKKPETVSPAMSEKRGCFVTLHKNGDLRGCIGTIECVNSLISCIEENAVNAAFHDPRFSPLKKEELADIDIEISVLTKPETLVFQDAQDLKKKLRPGKHGVILSKGWNRATFLPQVWEQLPETEIFLEHLCRKGGMNKDCWKDKDTVIKVYEAEYFSERN